MAKSAMPVEWHEDCLRSNIIYLQRRKNELDRIAADVSMLEANIAFYTKQIEEAKRLKKERFDRERFLHKRPSTRTKNKITIGKRIQASVSESLAITPEQS